MSSIMSAQVKGVTKRYHIKNEETNSVATCETKLFQNHFNLRRRPSEIILFRRMENWLKFRQRYFRGLLISAHKYFSTRSMSLRRLSKAE